MMKKSTLEKRPVLEERSPDYPKLNTVRMDRRLFLSLLGTAGVGFPFAVGCGGRSESESKTPVNGATGELSSSQRGDTAEDAASDSPQTGTEPVGATSESGLSTTGHETEKADTLFDAVVVPVSAKHVVRLKSGNTFAYRLRIVHDSPDKDPFGEKIAEAFLSQADSYVDEHFGSMSKVPDEAIADAEDALEKAFNEYLGRADDTSIRGVTIVGVSIEYYRKQNIPIRKGIPPRPTYPDDLNDQ